jgi:hypothetical protein
MQEFPINYLALLVAVAVKQVLGMIWFSPFAFGPAWMKLVGCDQAQMTARLPRAIGVDVIASFVMAFVLVHAVHYAGANTAALGAAVGFFNWIGFIAATTLGYVMYEKRPIKLFLIDNGYSLLALLLMGAIVAAWP